VGVVAVAVVVAGAVAPEDAARLLQGAVDVVEPGAHRGHVVLAVEHLEQRRQPAGLHQRVAVEQQHAGRAGHGHAEVGGGAVAAVGVLQEDARVVDGGEPRARGVRRGVVDDDQLVGDLGGVDQRPQGALRPLPGVVDD